jgi:hypothetical protein
VRQVRHVFTVVRISHAHSTRMAVGCRPAGVVTVVVVVVGTATGLAASIGAHALSIHLLITAAEVERMVRRV